MNLEIISKNITDEINNLKGVEQNNYIMDLLDIIGNNSEYSIQKDEETISFDIRSETEKQELLESIYDGIKTEEDKQIFINNIIDKERVLGTKIVEAFKEKIEKVEEIEAPEEIITEEETMDESIEETVEESIDTSDIEPEEKIEEVTEIKEEINPEKLAELEQLKKDNLYNEEFATAFVLEEYTNKIAKKEKGKEFLLEQEKKANLEIERIQKEIENLNQQLDTIPSDKLSERITIGHKITLLNEREQELITKKEEIAKDLETIENEIKEIQTIIEKKDDFEFTFNLVTKDLEETLEKYKKEKQEHEDKKAPILEEINILKQNIEKLENEIKILENNSIFNGMDIPKAHIEQVKTAIQNKKIELQLENNKLAEKEKELSGIDKEIEDVNSIVVGIEDELAKRNIYYEIVQDINSLIDTRDLSEEKISAIKDKISNSILEDNIKEDLNNKLNRTIEKLKELGIAPKEPTPEPIPSPEPTPNPEPTPEIPKKGKLKVIAKKALKWMKEHKLVTIGLGLALVTALMFAIPQTHMMINSALWNIGKSLGWSASSLSNLHGINLGLAKGIQGGKFIFEGMSGAYTLGGAVGAQTLYGAAGANLVAALTGLTGLGTIGTIGASIINKIKNRKKKNKPIEEKPEPEKVPENETVSEEKDKEKDIEKVSEKIVDKEPELKEEREKMDLEQIKAAMEAMKAQIKALEQQLDMSKEENQALKAEIERLKSMEIPSETMEESHSMKM